MAGRDITESLPVNIGNPGTTGFWTNTAEAYDIAVGGMPFFLVPVDSNPYQRETAPYRKDQFDNGKEPGEQSLTGWWLRSQSSFHCGSGINFYDPSSGESSAYRFNDSQGVDVFTKGQVTLLKDVTNTHVTTTSVGAKSEQHIRSVQWTSGGTTYNGVLLHDGYDVDRIDSNGTLEHWADNTTGTYDKVYGLADDGKYGYWVTNDSTSGKLEFNKKLISDGAAVLPTPMFTSPSITVTSAEVEYVKDRIIACINNAVYEIAPNATTLPSPVYTNPNTNYEYTSITASGPAIYTAGHSGIYSTIQKYTLNTTTGSMPVLTQASVAAELPPGEIVHKIYYYLGYMLIGTSRGVRVATVNDQDGSLAYGPLVFESTQPVYDFAARDRFVWCASGIGSVDGGLIRIDLGQPIADEPLRFAYANDLQVTQTTTHYTTAVGFLGELSRLAFATAHNTTNGAIYLEHPTQLVSTGYVKTGNIRFGTLEPKNYKFIRGRAVVTDGAVDIQIIGDTGDSYNVIAYNASVGTPEAATTSPETPQEYVSYKFTLSRSASNTSLGPVFKGYQVKALPATERQRLIQFPVWCFDEESDRYGVRTGYEGRAWERIQAIENIEKAGDIVNVQDFTTGERVQALIEKTNFVRRTPPQGGFDGFGGILTITVRTVL
jgi:hypothetical protein